MALISSIGSFPTLYLKIPIAKSFPISPNGGAEEAAKVLFRYRILTTDSIRRTDRGARTFRPETFAEEND